MESENWTFGNDDSGTPDNAPTRPLHIEGTFVLRVADAFPAQDGKNLKTGKPYPQITLVFVSNKLDAEGKPPWLFSTFPKNTYGGTSRGGERVGNPSRLRLALEAIMGHALGDNEAASLAPDNVIGRYVYGTVKHREVKGIMRARVETLMALPDGMEVDIPLESYVRPPKFGGGE